MSYSIYDSIDQDLQMVIEEARILAINARHGFINLDHFFVAMLVRNCQAKSYLSDFDVTIYRDWLQVQFAATGEQTHDDSLPLTVHAERIIRHAMRIASLHDHPLINSVHLLLAMLSYNNEVSILAKEKGIIFEDISAAYAGGSIPKTPIEIELRHFSKPSWLAGFIGLARSRASLLEDIYNHATDLYTYQQYDDCITTCKTGLEIDPNHRELKKLLADCFLNKRAFADAVVYLHELSDTYPDELDFPFSLSYCYSEIKDHKRSAEISTRLLAKYPENADLLNNIGFDLYQQGRYDEAVLFYEQAIQLDPSFAYPYNNLGFVKYKLGDTNEALTLIGRALELDRGDSFAYIFKGIIFFEQGNKVLAMEQFQLALKYGYTQAYGDDVLQWVEACRK